MIDAHLFAAFCDRTQVLGSIPRTRALRVCSITTLRRVRQAVTGFPYFRGRMHAISTILAFLAALSTNTCLFVSQALFLERNVTSGFNRALRHL